VEDAAFDFWTFSGAVGADQSSFFEHVGVHKLMEDGILVTACRVNHLLAHSFHQMVVPHRIQPHRMLAVQIVAGNSNREIIVDGTTGHLYFH